MITIMEGDCVAGMESLPDGLVDCCVTSPPYFGLRDYGCDGQIGLEPSPDNFVQAMVSVFREVRRVLRDDGTLWLNLGDSYAGSGKGAWAVRDRQKEVYVPDPGSAPTRIAKTFEGIKAKDLMGIPWMVAFALRADGWYLRQEIIWNKPNAMPEPSRDRVTKSHETFFLLSKKPRYYFDADAIREPEVCGRVRGPALRPDKRSTNGNGGLSRRKSDGYRNKRSVWTVNTKPFKGAHFATFPPDLIRPCVIAGSRPGGTVLDPFGGAGTTALVAREEGRNAIHCELNPDYNDIAVDRLFRGVDRAFMKAELAMERLTRTIRG